jgi:uncharacterized protein (TIGR02118 family)
LIRVTVAYPNGSGTHFDMSYYVNTHIPLVKKLVGPALKGVTVEPGLSGMQPGSPAPYAAIGQLLFDSVDSFQSGFGAHSADIVADVPNYADIQPIIQLSTVLL